MNKCLSIILLVVAVLIARTVMAATIDTTGTTIILNTDVPGNTYTGNGTLQVSDDGSGLIQLGTNGSPVTTFSMSGGLITIDGGVTLKNGGYQKGVWTSNKASMNVSGTLDLWDGNTVYVDALTGSGIIGSGQISGTQNLTVGNNNGSGTFSGTIVNVLPGGNRTVSLTKTGSGTQVLSGTNTFSGSVNLSVGTLQLTDTNAIGSATSFITGNGATLALRSDTSATFNVPQIANGLTPNFTIDINNNGSGSGNTLTLPNGIVFPASGDAVETINITGGNGYRLVIGSLVYPMSPFYGPVTLAPTNVNVTVNSVIYTNKSGSAAYLTLGGSSQSNTVESLGGTAWFGINKTGNSTWYWNANSVATPLNSSTCSGGTLVLNAPLYFVGASRYLTLSGGTLCLNSANALGNAGGSSTTSIIISGGNLDNASGAPISSSTYNPGMSWNGNFTFLGTNGTNSDLNIGTGTVTLGVTPTVTVNSNATLTTGGVISGAFGLTKSGTGTLKLTGANTYTGATTVTNGTLMVVAGGSCSNSAVTVSNAPGTTATLAVSVTNNTMQWTCASLTCNTNGVGSQLKFDFAVAPSTTNAPLQITGGCTLSSQTLVVMSTIFVTSGQDIPLMTVNGGAPSTIPSLSGVCGPLYWGGPGNNTLMVVIAPRGMVLTIR